jgi:PIN domain nuclease of toxin-antitoxin system
MGGDQVIILDTHAWIWWTTESNRLSSRAAKAVAEADALGVSIMSCWEVAMLVRKQRIAFKTDVEEWIALALQRPRVRLLLLDPKTAVRATRLPATAPDDPVDRMVIAECLKHGVPLVSKDHRIAASRLVQVIW